MEEIIHVSSESNQTSSLTDYTESVVKCFDSVPEVAKPLIGSAGRLFNRIEKTLYSAPAFVSAVKAAIPEEAYQVILTDELMTKKDGSLMANLINPETKKIVSTVSLGKVKLSPELSQAMTNYATQMQMAQIAEQIQFVQVAVEEVRQGQEYDRLATAYSCQQKLIQAAAIQNPRLKEMALMQLVSDAENSRNLLMQSQSANAAFIKNQPESTWGKILSGATPEKINARMNELRESLCAVNMVSLAEAIAYQEMGETEAAKVSLEYYAKFIQRTYLETKGFVERLDMIDPSPENYWTQKLPEIENRILALPSDNPALRLEDCEHCRSERAQQIKRAGKAALGVVVMVGGTAVTVLSKGKINPNKK